VAKFNNGSSVISEVGAVIKKLRKAHVLDYKCSIRSYVLGELKPQSQTKM